MDIMSGRVDVAIPQPGLTSHMRAALLSGYRETIARAEAELRYLRHTAFPTVGTRADRMRRLVARIATAEADMAEMEEIV